MGKSEKTQKGEQIKKMNMNNKPSIPLIGKMGKPQKSGKHKKMKPTFDTKRSSSILLTGNKKEKIHNMAPEKEDYQEMPRKVRDLMRVKANLQKSNTEDKKKMKGKLKKHGKKFSESFKMERGMSRPMKPAPRFHQGKFETDHKFMRRVEMETERVVMKSQMEDKYKMEIEDNGNFTNASTIKRPPSEKKKQKDKDRKKNKVQKIKQKKREKAGDFSDFKDVVQFGEVAMAPPTLTSKPRKATLEQGKPRPGTKGLLLSQMMVPKPAQSQDTQETSQSPSYKTNHQAKSLATRKQGQTVKRKFLSTAQKRITDLEREQAIEKYRKLKDSKLKSTIT